MFSISLPFLEDFDEVDEIDEERETEGSSASLVNPQERRRDNLEAFGIVGRGGTSSEASLWSRCGEDALLGSTGPSSEERALDVNVLGTSGLELIRDGLYLCLLSSSLSLWESSLSLSVPSRLSAKDGPANGDERRGLGRGDVRYVVCLRETSGLLPPTRG